MVENLTDLDCEDQGFTKLGDGCYYWKCLTFVKGKPVRPKLVSMFSPTVKKSFWICPSCKASYGEVEK